jgi:hypothetical protein
MTLVQALSSSGIFMAFVWGALLPFQPPAFPSANSRGTSHVEVGIVGSLATFTAAKFKFNDQV